MKKRKFGFAQVVIVAIMAFYTGVTWANNWRSLYTLYIVPHETLLFYLFIGVVVGIPLCFIGVLVKDRWHDRRIKKLMEKDGKQK